MMVDNKTYKMIIKEYDIDQLCKERNDLLKEIKRFESNQISEEEKMMKPDPLTTYQMNNEYLIMKNE